MKHLTSSYQDGYKVVRFCHICGKEDDQLFDSVCEPIFAACPDCGHLTISELISECSNCKNIRAKFNKALPKRIDIR